MTRIYYSQLHKNHPKDPRHGCRRTIIQSSVQIQGSIVTDQRGHDIMSHHNFQCALVSLGNANIISRHIDIKFKTYDKNRIVRHKIKKLRHVAIA